MKVPELLLLLQVAIFRPKKIHDLSDLLSQIAHLFCLPSLLSETHFLKYKGERERERERVAEGVFALGWKEVLQYSMWPVNI